MRKKVFAIGMLIILAGCGGGSVSEEEEVPIPKYEIGTLIITPTVPNITSDVLSRTLQSELVKTNPNNQCNDTTTVPLCTGATYSDDTVKFTFLLEQTAGYTASPVRITGYKVTYDNCVSGEVYIPLENVVLNPDEQRQIDIVVVPSEVKENVVQTEQFPYESPDGCLTTFTRPVYTGSCVTNALIEFDVVDILFGTNRKVQSQIQVKFEDVPGQNECQ